MKALRLLLLLSIVSIGLVACGGEGDNENGERAVKGTVTLAEEDVAVSEEHPLVIDKEAKTIQVYATVNGKYTLEPTRHGFNFKEGKFGNESLFISYANQTNFHDGLMELEAEPGNNLTVKTDGEYIEGSELDMTVRWDGSEKEYTISELVNASSGNPIAFKFGGNRDNSISHFTGCIACFDSCPVGVTSNSSEPQNSFDNDDVTFVGDKDILPADGTPVTVTFTVK